MRGEDRLDPLLGDHRGEAVAAQQDHVAGARRIGPGVDLDVRLRAERARDDRSLRMLGGLLLGQLPAAHELVDERVVLGEALERPVAEQVRAAVADVGDRDMGVVDVGGGQGRAHPGPPAIRARALVDLLVGLAHALGQALLRAAGVGQPPLERLDRDPRGDLAGLGAAHPVGDHEHRRPRVRAVLVVPPLAAGVGLAGGVRRAQHDQADSVLIAGRRTRSRRS